MSKKKTKFDPLKPGEWAYFKMRGHQIECCDCGLIHRMDFLVENKGNHIVLNNVDILFRAYRTNHKKGKPKKGKKKRR